MNEAVTIASLAGIIISLAAAHWYPERPRRSFNQSVAIGAGIINGGWSLFALYALQLPASTVATLWVFWLVSGFAVLALFRLDPVLARRRAHRAQEARYGDARE